MERTVFTVRVNKWELEMKALIMTAILSTLKPTKPLYSVVSVCCLVSVGSRTVPECRVLEIMGFFTFSGSLL